MAEESYLARAENISVRIVAASDVLGWSWLFPPFVWHFYARTLESTKAIFLDGANLLLACDQNHRFGYEVMQRIAQVVISRLEATQNRLLEIQKPAGTSLVLNEPKRDVIAGHMVAPLLGDLLAEHPFFKVMKADHLEILADAAMKVNFDAGLVIFRQGDPCGIAISENVVIHKNR